MKVISSRNNHSEIKNYFLLPGIPTTLLHLLKDNDQFCRLKAAECYYVIAST